MNPKNYQLIDDFPRGVPYKKFDEQKVPMSAWADPADILGSKALAWDPSKILLGAIGTELIGISDDRHICTIAGSRAGKGISAIIPNLIHYQGSVLAIDPKGELASITARRRKEGLKQDVWVLDPFERVVGEAKKYRGSFDPLSILKKDSPTIMEDAGLISDALIVTSPHSDPHWDDSARSFIEGVILHVVTGEDYLGERHLPKVYELLSKGIKMDGAESSMKGLVKEMKDNAGLLKTMEGYEDIGEAIEAAALDFDERPDREQGSVLSTIRRQIKFLGYGSMQNVLKDHDFDLTELKTARNGMTIYLCLPAGRMGICNRWLRLFVNLALEAMEREKYKPRIPVLLCLDEFAILGHMKQIEDAAGQIAGFGVKLWPILQDLNQLKTLYSDRWETFLGNSGILQFFGNNDVTTLEYIQKRLGKTPVKTQRENISPDKALGGESSGIELHDLITAEEAGRLFSRSDKKKRQLVIWSGKDPMVLERAVYYDKKSPVYKFFKGKFDVIEESE